MTAIAPGSASRIANAYYKTEEEFMHACGAAMREEYKAIIDAGLILQLDDPSIAENWDQINPEPTVEEYRRFTMQRVEALISPRLIIVGGGISRQADKWVPRLTGIRARIVPAALHNDAGIVGAAMSTAGDSV